jgi:hypothetical protein
VRNTVPINTLEPGTRFAQGKRTGKLIYLGIGSATVDVDANEERTFIPATGPNAGREVCIRTSRERTTWSLETPVTPL